MNEILINHNYDKYTVECIIRMERYTDTEDECEKISNELSEWSNNYELDQFSDERDKLLEFNKIFWMTNYMIYNKKIRHEVKIQVLAKIVSFIQRNRPMYSDQKLLNLILYFEDNLYYEIKNRTIAIKKSLIPELRIDDRTIKLSQDIIKHFQLINAKEDIYIGMNRKYDYKAGLSIMSDLLEILYFVSIEKEEFLKEKIIQNPKNGYNRRFFFLLLYKYFSKENEKTYLNKFFLGEYNRYSTSYIFIKMSKIKDKEEFIKFIESESIRLSNDKSRLHLLLEYVEIYEYYNKDIFLDDANEMLREILNFRIKKSSKPYRFGRINFQEFENDDIPRRYDAFRVSTSGDFKSKADSRFLKFTLLQKVLYTLDIFLFVHEHENLRFGNLYQSLNKIDDIGKFKIELEGIEWNNSEVIENIDIFEFEVDWVKKIQKLLPSFNLFLTCYEKANIINTNLKEFLEKYSINGPVFRYDKTALTNFDSCFSDIKFTMDDIYLLGLINVDFWEIIEDIFYNIEEDLNFTSVFHNYKNMLCEIKKNDLSSTSLKKLHLIQDIKQYEILTLEISADNLWVAKRNIIFRSKEKFLYNYFVKNVSLECKGDFVILLLNKIFNYGYTALIKSTPHLDKIFGVENMFDYIYKNRHDLMKLNKNDLLAKIEGKYNFAFLLDENAIQKNIFLFLLSVTFFDYNVNAFEKKATEIIKLHIINETNDNEIIDITKWFYWNVYALFRTDTEHTIQNFELISKFKNIIIYMLKRHIYVDNVEYTNISSFSLNDNEVSSIKNDGIIRWNNNYLDDRRTAFKKIYLFNTMAIFYSERDDDRNDDDSTPKIIKKAISLIDDINDTNNRNLLDTEESFGVFVKEIKDNYNYIKSFDIE
jgi:hypothetical protein